MTNVSINPEVIWDEVDGVLRLCHTGRVEYFDLDETGAAIWKECAEQTSVDNIVLELKKNYPDEDTAELSSEVELFVQSLEDANLLIVAR